MNICFILVLYNTARQEVERLKRETKNYRVYLIDNTKSKEGYAAGVNKGLKKAMSKNFDVFVVCNPDISIKGIQKKDIENLSKKFDIGGFTMKQNGKTYYGGEIDRWRMSGGLITRKPKKEFQEVDFVSGSLMAVSRKTIEKIGLFDESYGMYYEDVDYCIRAKRKGLRVGIHSKIAYDHFEIFSQNTSKEFYLFKNRLKILWKYGTTSQKVYEFLRLPKTVWETIVRGL